jgi:hypothetical protein
MRISSEFVLFGIIMLMIIIKFICVVIIVYKIQIAQKKLETFYFEFIESDLLFDLLFLCFFTLFMVLMIKPLSFAFSYFWRYSFLINISLSLVTAVLYLLFFISIRFLSSEYECEKEKEHLIQLFSDKQSFFKNHFNCKAFRSMNLDLSVNQTIGIEN